MQPQLTREELIAIHILCENRAVEVQRVIDEQKDAPPSIRRDNQHYVKYLQQLRDKVERLIG